MKTFIIEREIPGASELTRRSSRRSRRRPTPRWRRSGVPYNWVTSYVAGDKVYLRARSRGRRGHPRARPPGRLPGEQGDVVANEFGPQTADLVAS